MKGATQINLLGVRGSAPVSGAQHAQFGGDTPAVEILADRSRIFIDAGSGLARAGVGQDGDIDLILSHYHFDHLIGLPFFEPAWRLSGRLRIWAPKLDECSPLAVLNAFYAPPYCPVRLDSFRMQVEVRSYDPGDAWSLDGGVDVSTMLNNHPGGSAAVRISAGGASMVYASDTELGQTGEAARLAAFAGNATLLVVDAMNNESNAEARRGWGHSSWIEGAAAGIAAGAERIALFHHDPRANDQALALIEAEARALDPRLFLARQGAELILSTVAPKRQRGPTRGENVPWRCSK